MSEKVTYNTELMDDIAAKFDDGYDKLAKAIRTFISFKSTFEENYDGQVNEEIFETLSTTLNDHLTLLQMCYSNMSEYVTTSKDEMVGADKSLSKLTSGSRGSERKS